MLTALGVSMLLAGSSTACYCAVAGLGNGRPAPQRPEQARRDRPESRLRPGYRAISSRSCRTRAKEVCYANPESEGVADRRVVVADPCVVVADPCVVVVLGVDQAPCGRPRRPGSRRRAAGLDGRPARPLLLPPERLPADRP